MDKGGAVRSSIDADPARPNPLPVSRAPLPVDRRGAGRVTDLAGLCSWLASSERSANGCEPEFPLYKRAVLRSNISLAQEGSEISPCELSSPSGAGTIPTLFFNILTLAGPAGPLPLQLSDTMTAGRKSGGGALHAFLDLINRRFWELLLQSYRTGARPQHGFNHQASRALVFRLAEACAGFDPMAEDAAPPSPLGRPYLLSYSFQTSSGFGGELGFDELLQRTLGRPLSIEGDMARPVPVAASCFASLGRAGGRRSLGRGAILGCRAFVRRQMRITVHGVDADELEQFVPGDDARALRATRDSLNLALRGRVDPFTLRSMVGCRHAGGGARLGSKTCRRLGWGLLLGWSGAQTAMVSVSARQIDNSK